VANRFFVPDTYAQVVIGDVSAPGPR
jgi:hypothetical protein